MSEFKKPYHHILFASFVAGEGCAAAARAAGVSEPTARKFRDDYSQVIRDAQLRSTDGVLEQLKEMLPEATGRLRKWLAPPPPLVPAACNCGAMVSGSPTHVLGCASLGKLTDDHYRGHAADMKTIDRIINAYEVMRDVDFEKRLKKLERDQAEAKAAAAKNEGK